MKTFYKSIIATVLGASVGTGIFFSLKKQILSCESKSLEKSGVLKPLTSIAFDRDGGGDYHFVIKPVEDHFSLTVVAQDFKTVNQTVTIKNGEDGFAILSSFFKGGNAYRQVEISLPKRCMVPLGTWKKWTFAQDDLQKIIINHNTNKEKAMNTMDGLEELTRALGVVVDESL